MPPCGPVPYGSFPRLWLHHVTGLGAGKHAYRTASARESDSSAREGRAVRFQEILRAFLIFSVIIITIINIIIMLVDSSAPMHARATYAIVCGMGLVAAAGSLC